MRGALSIALLVHTLDKGFWCGTLGESACSHAVLVLLGRSMSCPWRLCQSPSGSRPSQSRALQFLRNSTTSTRLQRDPLAIQCIEVGLHGIEPYPPCSPPSGR